MPKPRRNAKYTSSRRWSVADARAVLAAHDASKLSPSAFAAREGFDVQRLHRWRRRLAVVRAPGVKATPAKAAFVEVQRRAVGTVDVVLRCGRLVRVAETICPTTLKGLVEALEAASTC